MYKLLIVEDEALERRALRIIINKNFNDIDIIGDAKTGLDAVELARKFKPDIILMDIEMPEASGLEAQEAIIEFLPNVTTIILSAYDNFQFAQTAIRLKVFDYILKPAKPSDLSDVLGNAIDHINKLSMQSNIASSGKDEFTGNEFSQIINAALKYINNNYNQNINLESVASYIHLNPQYFSRYFKNSTGMNFVDYLSLVRVREAKKMLLTTDFSIAEVSLKMGYIDPSYFSKVFMKYEGVTPNKFRCCHRR
ncbi:response regulator [Clostridium sp. JN-9]|uniref:response regulator transcription factor n=1 Tax=Clostridium sp. JN-9 TaxID=2507159 RepID=UPI000FFDFA6C|nr:response regulator [Clostridium sp. JN-9]QAT40392.1 response regulator [Clostridium sp. JN-9]